MTVSALVSNHKKANSYHQRKKQKKKFFDFSVFFLPVFSSKKQNFLLFAGYFKNGFLFAFLPAKRQIFLLCRANVFACQALVLTAANLKWVITICKISVFQVRFNMPARSKWLHIWLVHIMPKTQISVTKCEHKGTDDILYSPVQHSRHQHSRQVLNPG